jgi:hypothetical protein
MRQLSRHKQRLVSNFCRAKGNVHLTGGVDIYYYLFAARVAELADALDLGFFWSEFQ